MMMVVAVFFLYARGGMNMVYQMFFVGFIAIAAWTAFQKPISAPAYGPAFWRAKIANGWVPLAAQDFYLELARYKEERGIGGQLTGDVAWGRAYFISYLGTMGIAILIVWFLSSWPAITVLFVFSAVEFPLAFGCMFLYGRRNRRQFDQAVKQGYRFARVRGGALHRLQP